MSNYDEIEEADFKIEKMDYTETKPKNGRFNMKKAIHYVNNFF